ncbi:MAG: hypothetical protein AB1649_09240 [Chloroflexota bacterium]
MNELPKSQEAASAAKSMGVGIAILIGELLINVPVSIIILSFACSSLALALSFVTNSPPCIAWIAMPIFIVPTLIGIVLAWVWWSFSVPRWRRWALRNGIPTEKLQKWGVIAGLVWPKGWIFEKTEFKLKD